MSDPTPKTTPWKDAAWITAMAGLALLLVTAIKSCADLQLQASQQEHALAIESKRFAHEVNRTYLEHAVSQSVETRRLTLELLKGTLDHNEPLWKWANAELALLSQVQDAAQKVAAAEGELSEVQRELDAERSQSEADKKALRSTVSRLESDLSKLRGELQAASRDANVPSSFTAGCCVTCLGKTICGESVTTSCGSCVPPG